MFIIHENEREYRFGGSGPKYLMRGPRMNFGLILLRAGEDLKAHYHNVMEENFFILEGEADVEVEGVKHHLKQGSLIHIEPKEVHYTANNSDMPVKMIAVLAPYMDTDKVEVDRV